VPLRSLPRFRRLHNSLASYDPRPHEPRTRLHILTLGATAHVNTSPYSCIYLVPPRPCLVGRLPEQWNRAMVELARAGRGPARPVRSGAPVPPATAQTPGRSLNEPESPAARLGLRGVHFKFRTGGLILVFVFAVGGGNAFLEVVSCLHIASVPVLASKVRMRGRH
jgi:hypothetical protein